MELDQAKLVEIDGSTYECMTDERTRFRLPEEMADRLGAKLQAAGHKLETSGGVSKLGFYLAPGPDGRILIYPEPNYRYATYCVENPPKHIDRKRAQQIRRFFYGHVKYVENDKLRRVVLPEGLAKLAGLDDEHRKVVLVPRRYSYELMTEETFNRTMAADLATFNADGEDVLNPFESEREEREGGANE